MNFNEIKNRDIIDDIPDLITLRDELQSAIINHKTRSISIVEYSLLFKHNIDINGEEKTMDNHELINIIDKEINGLFVLYPQKVTELLHTMPNSKFAQDLLLKSLIETDTDGIINETKPEQELKGIQKLMYNIRCRLNIFFCINKYDS